MAIQTQIGETKFSIGDKIRLDYLIKEGDKERTQAFEGTVISIRGRGENRTFTLRKIGSDNIGIERIFPLNTPWIKAIKLIRHPKRRIRRSKLLFTRNPRARKI